MCLRGAVLALCCVAAGDPLTIYTLPSSSAVLGSAALLKCRFNIGGPINLTTLQVHWYFSDQSMAQYDRRKETFAPGVSISKQELLIGNASLGMENVQISDEGQYKCVVGYGAEQQQSETTLRVLAAPRLFIPRREARTDTATSFPCHVWGFYPQDVTVTWLRDRRVLTNATHSAPQRNPDGTFNLTLTYTFTPTASDSGSIFFCHVSHAALVQPLWEEFVLAVTVPRAGVDHTSTVIGVTLGILVAGGAAAATAIYCWRKRREGPSSAVGTPPKALAGSKEKMRGEDTVLMGNDGVSDSGEGSEQQPLLPAQGQEQSETQQQDGVQGTGPSSAVEMSLETPDGSREKTHGEDTGLMGNDGVNEARKGPEQQPLLPAQGQEQSETQEQDGVQVTDSPGSGVSESQEGGEAITAVPHPRAPAPHGESSANANTGLAGLGTAGASAELTGQQGRDVAPSVTAVWTGEPAANMEPATAQEEDAQGETGDNGLLRPPEVSEISQPESVMVGEEITLSCRMMGHFPEVLSVAWLRRDRVSGAAVRILNFAEYRIEYGAPCTQDGKSFQQQMRLSFTPSVQRDQGAEYVCQVGHVALRTPLERRSQELQIAGRAHSAPTKPSKSENRSREEEPASSPGAAAVTGPLVEEGAGDMAPKGNAGGDGGAETKSASGIHKGTTMTQNDKARATPAREQAMDGAVSPTPAKGGITSDASAKERVGDNAADENTTSDASAKERVGDNAADMGTTSELAEGGPGGARPAINVVGDRVASTTPVTKVLPDAVVSASPAGGPEAEASATHWRDDADREERVEEPGANGTGSSEQTA